MSAIPTGIVRAGLALEDRPRAAADLAVAEHREHHRRIGRRERRAEDERRRPVEAEQDVREARRSRAAVPNVPSTPSDAIGTSAAAEAAPADVHAAVEQDHDQRDDRDPLDRDDRVAARCRSGREEVGRRSPPRAGRARAPGAGSARVSLLVAIASEKPAADDEDDRAELGDLVHGRGSYGGGPSRKPASSGLTLSLPSAQLGHTRRPILCSAMRRRAASHRCSSPCCVPAAAWAADERASATARSPSATATASSGSTSTAASSIGRIGDRADRARSTLYAPRTDCATSLVWERRRAAPFEALRR